MNFFSSFHQQKKSAKAGEKKRAQPFGCAFFLEKKACLFLDNDCLQARQGAALSRSYPLAFAGQQLIRGQ
jgi:hypothetical protein